MNQGNISRTVFQRKIAAQVKTWNQGEVKPAGPMACLDLLSLNQRGTEDKLEISRNLKSQAKELGPRVVLRFPKHKRNTQREVDGSPFSHNLFLPQFSKTWFEPTRTSCLFWTMDAGSYQTMSFTSSSLALSAFHCPQSLWSLNHVQVFPFALTPKLLLLLCFQDFLQLLFIHLELFA